MTTTDSPRVSRRGFFRAAAGAAALGGTAGTASAQAGQSHTIDMTDGLVFDPDSLTVAPGDTVVWENVGSIGHSITAYEEDIPEEAAYFASGGFDAEQPARDAYSAGSPDSGDVAGGDSYEHTFDVEGSYDYFCVPHEAAGMVASLEVVEGGGGGDGGPPVPQVPEQAQTLAVVVSAAMVAVLGLTFFFLKYGGEYGFDDE
jgi:plastocyanin